MKAEDKTGQTEVTISFGAAAGFKYVPPCITVDKGTTVKFNGGFAIHPLVGGEVKGGVGTPDANSPIKSTSMGTTASFPLAEAGTFPYYCSFHATLGMMGAIFVK